MSPTAEIVRETESGIERGTGNETERESVRKIGTGTEKETSP